MLKPTSLIELTDTQIMTEAGPINRNAFEKWVDDNGKREWINVVSDERGEPCEGTGKYDWDIYYKDGCGVEYDITEYLAMRNRTKTTAKLVWPGIK